MGWANEIPGRTPFYCMPAKTELGVENFLVIIDREIEAYASRLPDAELEKLSIGFLLIQGLQEFFPCKGN